MNCKEGDIAFMVRSVAGNEGLVLTCLKIATADEILARGFHSKEPVWIIDRPINNLFGPKVDLCVDSILCPIRDQPGADETLSWCDVPKEVTA